MDSDILRERLEDSLAVAVEHVNESFTIIGKTGDMAKEGLVLPRVPRGAGRGTVPELDSTIASALAGAIKFLDVYPYECVEQVTSKLFARVLFPSSAGSAADLSTLVRFANPGRRLLLLGRPGTPAVELLRVAAGRAPAGRGAGEEDEDPGGHRRRCALGSLERAGIDQRYLPEGVRPVRPVLVRKGERAKADSLAQQGDEIGVFGYGFLGLSSTPWGTRDPRSRS